MTSKNQHKVIIIGGGVAGITAGVHLSKAEIPFLLLEQKNFLGGRTYSLTDNITGDEIDNGQHVMMGIYHNFLEVIDSLGTDKYLSRQDSLKVPYRNKDGEQFVLDTSKFPGKAGILWGILKLNSLGFVDKLNILRFVLKLQSGIIKSRGFTVLELLKSSGQTERAIKYFWEPITLATLNTKMSDASDDLLITVLKLAFFGKPEDSQMIIPRVGLSKLYSSFDQFVGDSDSDIRYQSKVSRLLFLDNKCFGVELSSGEQYFAENVISCIQPNGLSKILDQSGKSIENSDKFKFSSIISAYLWYDEDFIDHDLVSCLDTNIQWIFNRNRITDRNNAEFPGHYAVTISAAEELADKSKDDLIDIIQKEMKQLFPESKNAQLMHFMIFKDKRATPLLDPETNSIRPDTMTDIENLYLAGDWTNTGLPATIEGAALSGKKAVEMIINDLGKEPSS